MNVVYYGNELYHYGVKGQKWGERRYQNEDGSYTPEGMRRYGLDAQQRLTSKEINVRTSGRDIRKFTEGQERLRRDQTDRLIKEERAQYIKDKKEFGRKEARKRMLDNDENMYNRYLDADKKIDDNITQTAEQFYSNVNAVELENTAKARAGRGVATGILAGITGGMASRANNSKVKIGLTAISTILGVSSLNDFTNSGSDSINSYRAKEYQKLKRSNQSN